MNGNAGRFFYTCQDPQGRCGRNGWVTWADMKGVLPFNQHCRCRKPSRICETGWRSVCRPSKMFWVCAEGKCGFTAWDPWTGPEPSVEDQKNMCEDIYHHYTLMK